MSEHTKGRLVPKFAGEFTSYQQWVNKGASWLKSPDHRRAMCIDALGRRVAIGADFMRAHDEDAFPVRFFWECELNTDTDQSELAAARALLQQQDALLGQKACATKECRELLAARALQLETKKELLIARAIIRGLIDDPMCGVNMYKQAHAKSYLDACDTPEGAPNAG